MSGQALHWLEPDWPAAQGVRVVSTLRHGGVSVGPYASMNMALHVGDDPEAVRQNRRRLQVAAEVPDEPLWLEQVHGTNVVVHEGRPGVAPVRADAAVAFEAGRVCVVMTADCLPVVFTDRAGSRIAVAHAGWRGLADGVLEATIHALNVEPGNLLAWMGPAIAQPSFEVGPEVRDAVLRRAASLAGAFEANAAGRYQADLYALARGTLERAGVRAVFGGGWCTRRDPESFFSYRRDGTTGRMATLAWIG